jgi:uncharacterized protein with HEPN domain
LPSSLRRHDPADCLADIVENAERIEGYLAGMDRAGFQADGRTRDAVERCVERVCEAVVRLGDRAEALCQVIPGAMSAAPATGCAMPTTASTLT